MREPKLGEIVHYIDGHGCEYPAIITDVSSIHGDGVGRCDLVAFGSRFGSSGSLPLFGFDYDASGKVGTWHFVEDVA